MVVGLVPDSISNLDLEDVVDLKIIGAPGLGQGSSPSFGYERRHSEKGGEPIFEDASIDFVVFVDGHDAIPQCRLDVGS